MGISTEGLDLGYSDCLFRTVNGSIFILSGNKQSIRGAVMEYLGTELGVEVYASNCYSVDRKGEDYVLNVVSDVVHYDMDIRTTDNPFFTIETRYEMGYVGRDNSIFAVSASAHQTITYYVPIADYYIEHPKWYNNYSTNAEMPTQVCYNANGDEAELLLMKQAFLSRMIAGLKRDSSAYIFIIGNQDNEQYCTCSACSIKKATYGVHNASALHFCNDLADMLNEWMATEEGAAYKRDFEILFLAYQSDIGAPAKYNSTTGVYEPIDDSVVCKENVSVFFAPIHMDFKSSIYADVNTTTRVAFEGWKACSDEISLYLYQTNYQDALVYFDAVSCMQELYQFFATGNIKFVHNSGNGSNAITPGWEVLTGYLQSVLSKDVDADLEDAKDAFFTSYYGVAAEPMRKYFDSYMEWTAYLRANGIYESSAIPVYELLVRKPNYWSTEKFSLWLGYVDEALAAIKVLETTDKEIYDILYSRIVLERIPICYIANEMISSFGASLEGMSAEQCRMLVKADCDMLGITERGRLGSLENLFVAWGLA